jgi:Cdc6-like AAA superfamily ATPase
MHLIDASKGVSSNYDSIRDLFDDIKDFTSRLTVHTRQSVPEELKGTVTEILVCLIGVCGYSEKLIRHGRMGQYLKRVLLGQDEIITEKLKKLRKLVESEQRMVAALTLSISTNTSSKVEGAVVLLEKTNESIHQLRTELFQQFASRDNTIMSPIEDHRSGTQDTGQRQLHKIRAVLRPSSTSEEIYRTIASKRVPGTGDWIRENPIFRSWLEREKPILWLSGRPGAGKSYLSSNIIQHLLQLHPQGVRDASRTSIAYYFCKDYDPDLRSFKKALRTLSYAICMNDPIYAKHVATVCSFPDDIRTTYMIWQRLFVDFYSKESDNLQNTVYVIIDGLDEAFEEERRNFLELLRVFSQDSPTRNGKLRVQIVLIGRPELSQVLDDILGESIPTITISAENNSGDIIEYVRTSVAKIKNLRKVPKELRSEIVSALTKGADGMFLWVDLMLQEIANKHHQGQIREALRTAPKGLKDTIRHVLERFSQDLQPDDIDDLNELLSWVTCAKRPLTLGELDDIMKIKSKDGTGFIDLESELRKRFASFFAVSREDGLGVDELQLNLMRQYVDETGDTEQNDSEGSDSDVEFDASMEIASDPLTTEVTLAHASIGDYLRDETEARTTAVGVDVNQSQAAITITLMSIVCDKNKFEKWKDATLATYACNYWQDHLASIKIDSTDLSTKTKITSYLIMMIRNPEIAVRWMAKQRTLEKTWFHHDRNRSTLRNWLINAKADIPGEISEVDIQWIDSLYPRSDADVMDLAADIVITEWLKEFAWDQSLMFRCLRAHISSVSSTPSLFICC